MKLDLNRLIFDLESFEPETLSSIVFFVQSHSDYSKIAMLVRNSRRSAKVLLNECLGLIAENSPISDVQLAGLLVIVAVADNDLYSELVSSTSDGIGNYHWSRAMAASYLIHKEVLSETIRKSA
jgi:hypothetical protein